MEGFGKFVVGVVLLVITYLYVGWIGHLIWNWYVASLFGIMTITFKQSIGLSIASSFFCKTTDLDKEDVDFDDMMKAWIKAICYLTIVWTVAFCFSLVIT